MSEFSLGIDFGSNSARALIVNIADGSEYGSTSCVYEGGCQGVYTDSCDHNLARQHPDSYLKAMEECVIQALANARRHCDFRAENIVGIGIDATASTPIPVDSKLKPLAGQPRFKDNLNAYAWMWKDHTALEEAACISRAAAQQHPEYLEMCGGTYSPEWFWAKVWHCLKVDPALFNAAGSWLDFPDFVPSVLGGINDISEVKGSICAAGHKALFSDDWGGFPASDFLAGLATELAVLRKNLFPAAYPSDRIAANLCPEWAGKLGLPAGIVIAVGIIDAHAGAVGAGVGSGRMVKIIGTSSCDIIVRTDSGDVPVVPGICGMVKGSVLPGSFGIEAGQAAVGDIFDWFVSCVCKADHQLFRQLEADAAALCPGQSGLMALDWQNGNRNILCDQQLSGMLVGMTLHTTQAEIFRALIEATAFGARRIIDRLEEYGIGINEIVCCGGIAEKSPLLMQIYADVLDCKLLLPASNQSCALGAAIFGAVAAGKYPSLEDAQSAICNFKEKQYIPDPSAVEKYSRLYELYCELHDSFGTGHHGSLMKKLISMKKC